MNILIVGRGGREHALVWKLAQSKHKPNLFCAPGNAGTADLATNVALKAEDVDGLTSWCRQHRPDLVVIGPEAPLCLGLADRLRDEGIRVFGPGRDGARLEGSKTFAKQVMQSAGVPTAQAWDFSDAEAALAFLADSDGAWVVKADGLAAGKGVTLCAGRAEAEQAVKQALLDHTFGEAGACVLLEEYLEGEEVSVLALVDGKKAVLLPSSQDHKRALEGDQGPNTGGMGAYSPVPVMNDLELASLHEIVFAPVLDELSQRGIDFCGVLYAGLMITDTGPKVLEFNTRFGDPEAQCILPRLQSDLVDVLLACVAGELDHSLIDVSDEVCACVILASAGYPGSTPSGVEIKGLDHATGLQSVQVFHAGTAKQDHKVVTDGGRVLGVTGWGSSLSDALDRAYCAVDHIHFEGLQFRRDIGAKALA